MKRNIKLNVYISEDEMKELDSVIEGLPFKPAISEVLRKLIFAKGLGRDLP